MKYIKLFGNEAEYLQKRNQLESPWLALSKEEGCVHLSSEKVEGSDSAAETADVTETDIEEETGWIDEG